LKKTRTWWTARSARMTFRYLASKMTSLSSSARSGGLPTGIYRNIPNKLVPPATIVSGRHAFNPVMQTKRSLRGV
jgi:hypothetical protein